MRRALFVAVAAVLCLAAAVGIVVLVSGESGYTAERLGWTAAALLLFELAAAAGIAVLDEPRWGVIGWLCQLVTLAGVVVVTIMIWSTPEGREVDTDLEKAVASLFVASFALAHLSLLGRRRAEAGRVVRTLVWGTRVAVVTLAGTLLFGILDQNSDDTYYRVLASVAILWVLGTALVPIGRRLAYPR